MLTGLRPESMRHLQLGEGVFLEGFDPSALTSCQALADTLALRLEDGKGVLGATVGVSVFRCVPRLRCLEAGGLRAPTPGNMVNDGWTVRLTGTLREFSPDNLQRVLPGAYAQAQGEGLLLRVASTLRPGDFLPQLCWVGHTGGGLMLIELTHVLNTAGAVWSFVPRGEGTLPFVFEAHTEMEEDAAHAPCRILLF